MVIDTSAVIAILLREPGSQGLVQAIRQESTAISAVAVLEASIVVRTRLARDGEAQLDELIALIGLEIVPFDVTQLLVAREAFVRYGRGSGSRAKLNFGDCCTYALAKTRDQPLLFVGNDFSHTDIVSAI